MEKTSQISKTRREIKYIQMKVIQLKFYNQRLIHNAICLFNLLNSYYINFIKNNLLHNDKYYAQIKYNSKYTTKYFYFNNVRFDANSIKQWIKQVKQLKRQHNLEVFK